MITIRRFWNVKTVKVRSDTFENIGILREDGSYEYESYIDSIELQKIKFLTDPMKVKLESDSYKLTDNMNEPWVELAKEEHLIGARIKGGVYLVTNHGVPMVI
jgi:hypothetical protein